jgi:hypothetical protein
MATMPAPWSSAPGSISGSATVPERLLELVARQCEQLRDRLGGLRFRSL